MRYLLFFTLTVVMLAPFAAFADQKQDIRDILNEVSAYADKDPSVLEGAVFSVGDAYVRENKIDEAIALYEKSINIIPGNENLLNRIGNLYNQNRQYNKAAGIYEKLTEIKPDNTWYFQMLTNVYNMSGQKDKADEIWKRLIQEKPDNADILAQVANFYSNANDMDNAINLAEKSVQLAPDNVGYLQNLATFYSRTEKFDKAEEAYEKIVAMAQDQWLKEWANREILNIYQKQNRLGEAESKFEDEVKNRPDDIVLLKNLAELYMRKGEKEKALEIYEKAVRVSANDRDVNNSLVSLYESMGKPDKAIELLKKIIEAAPNEPYLLENLARLYDKLGKKEDAKKAWQSLVSKVTTDPALYSRYAEALYGWKDLDEAVVQLDKAQNMDPGNMSYTLRKAAILIDAGKIEEAKVALGKVNLDAKDDWMKAEARRRLDEIANMPVSPAPARETVKEKIEPAPAPSAQEPLVVEMKAGQEEGAAEIEKPKKKKKRGWFR